MMSTPLNAKSMRSLSRISPIRNRRRSSCPISFFNSCCLCSSRLNILICLALVLSNWRTISEPIEPVPPVTKTVLFFSFFATIFKKMYHTKGAVSIHGVFFVVSYAFLWSAQRIRFTSSALAQWANVAFGTCLHFAYQQRKFSDLTTTGNAAARRKTCSASRQRPISSAGLCRGDRMFLSSQRLQTSTHNTFSLPHNTECISSLKLQRKTTDIKCSSRSLPLRLLPRHPRRSATRRVY